MEKFFWIVVFHIVSFLNFLVANPYDSKSDKSPLSGLQNFEVVTLFSPYEQFDQKTIYNTMSDSFKTIGEVTVSEEQSLFTTLPHLQSSHPVCYFSIGRLQGRVEILLDVLGEVEITSNHFKMTCPIWKNKSSVKFSEDKNLLNVEIADVIKKMVNNFAEEYSKANSKQLHPSFQIREFKEL